jgi:UDPglucose 6-dehydrogenase
MGLDKRIGSKFLHAGPGYGGSCFPKDTMALAIFAREARMPSRIVDATIEVNRRQRIRMLEKIETAVGSLDGKVVAVLGLSFKPQTDDVRDSVGVDLVRMLQKKGAKVRAFDPVAMARAAEELRNVYFAEDSYDAATGADALVIATEWNEFRMLDLTKLRRLLRRPIVIDCRNIYEPDALTAAGFQYEGVGRGRRVPARGAASVAGNGAEPEGDGRAASRTAVAKPRARSARAKVRS